MKIVLDEGDRRVANSINENNYPAGGLMFCDPEQEYTITFKIKDKGKANNFIFSIFSPTEKKREEIENFEEQSGIEVISVGIDRNNNNKLKQKLHAVIDEIFKEE